MSDKIKFSGMVVRVEKDGFGVVKFDDVVGDNTHAVFSTSISEALPLLRLKPGVRVSGMVEVDSSNDLAAVRTLSVE